MSCARRDCRAAIALALLALPVAGAAAQQVPPEGDRDAVARQVRQTVEQLQRVHGDRRAAAEAHRGQVAQLEQQIEQLEGQLQPIAADVAAEQKRIAELEKQIEDHQQSGDAAAAWIGDVAAAAQQITDALLQRVAHGTGSRSQVVLRQAAESLDSTDPAVQAEGLKMLLTFAGEQWPALRSVSLANQPLLFRKGEQMEHAWVLQIGSAAKVFVSEDEQTVGVWSGRPDEPWILDVPGDVRRQIIELVGIVRETRPPGLAPLPILVPADSEGAPQ